MRISDWSSDVCSSDLEQHDHDQHAGHEPLQRLGGRLAGGSDEQRREQPEEDQRLDKTEDQRERVAHHGLELAREHMPGVTGGVGAHGGGRGHRDAPVGWTDAAAPAAADSVWDPPSPASRSVRRSEEHTSELQSLMRISYAVFCLKKKKT